MDEVREKTKEEGLKINAKKDKDCIFESWSVDEVREKTEEKHLKWMPKRQRLHICIVISWRSLIQWYSSRTCQEIKVFRTMDYFRWTVWKKIKVPVYSLMSTLASIFSRLFTPWHGTVTRAHPAHVDPTLDSCTRYLSLLGDQRYCRMRSLPKAPTRDQCRENAYWDCEKHIHEDERYLASSYLSLGLKKRMVKCYKWPALLHGCETWTVATEQENRMEAFEMWIYQRMFRISYLDRITNEEVLHRANEQRLLLPFILEKKSYFFTFSRRK